LPCCGIEDHPVVVTKRKRNLIERSLVCDEAAERSERTCNGRSDGWGYPVVTIRSQLVAPRVVPTKVQRAKGTIDPAIEEGCVNLGSTCPCYADRDESNIAVRGRIVQPRRMHCALGKFVHEGVCDSRPDVLGEAVLHATGKVQTATDEVRPGVCCGQQAD